MTKNSKFGMLGLAVISAFIMALPQAQAQSADRAGWIGGLFGLSVPNYENTNSRTGYGITGGAKVGSEFGVGAYFYTTAQDETFPGGKSRFATDLYGVEGAYHFEGEAKGVYVGGRLGTSKVTLATVTTSPMHWGVVGGYNYMLSGPFSLGGELSWINIPESTGTAAGAASSTTIKAFSLLNFTASLKFWF